MKSKITVRNKKDTVKNGKLYGCSFLYTMLVPNAYARDNKGSCPWVYKCTGSKDTCNNNSCELKVDCYYDYTCNIKDECTPGSNTCANNVTSPTPC